MTSDKSQDNIKDIERLMGGKRKKYILTAIGQDIHDNLKNVITSFFKTNIPNYTLVHLKNKTEFSRYLTRQVKFIIIDDSFSSMNENIEFIKNIKTKHHETSIPTTILTNNPNKLVKLYNKTLLQFQEVDQYMPTNTLSESKLYEVLKLQVNRVNARKSRRLKFNQKIKIITPLEEVVSANLNNISFHGAQIECPSLIFKIGQFYRIRITLRPILPIQYGEFIWLTSKVRRILISGNIGGFSWEDLNASQKNVLADFLIQSQAMAI